MQIRLTVDISGTHNGQPWPRRGTVLDLPDDEAWPLLHAQVAERVRTEPPRAPVAVQTGSRPQAQMTTTAPASTAPAKKDDAQQSASGQSGPQQSGASTSEPKKAAPSSPKTDAASTAEKKEG